MNHLQEVTHAEFARGAGKTGHVRDEYRALGAEPVPDALAYGLGFCRIRFLGKVRNQVVEFRVPRQGFVKRKFCHVYPNVIFLIVGRNGQYIPEKRGFC